MLSLCEEMNTVADITQVLKFKHKRFKRDFINNINWFLEKV